jgi:hypothetical protein
MKCHHLHIWELCIFLLARRLWDGICSSLRVLVTYSFCIGSCRSCILFTRTPGS